MTEEFTTKTKLVAYVAGKLLLNHFFVYPRREEIFEYAKNLKSCGRSNSVIFKSESLQTQIQS